MDAIEPKPQDPTEIFEIRRYENAAGVVIHARHMVGDMIGSPLSFHGQAQLMIQGRGQITLQFPIPAATLTEAFDQHLECAKVEQQRVVKEIADNQRRAMLMQNAQNMQAWREHRKR